MSSSTPSPRSESVPRNPNTVVQGLDDMVPTRGYELLPLVGLGGSAGGIAALQSFFAAMPTDSGMAFVVILHLAPERESGLVHLLQQSTAMRVVSATDGVQVEPNSVYVIPPGKYLASVDGHLRLSELKHEGGRRVAVDLFFRTLADTHGPHSVAIVLSGADGDGAIGIKRIKERGGLTIAQEPEEAEHKGMPRSAIATGMVDWVLKTAHMPARLIEYSRNERHLMLPTEEGPSPGSPASVAPTEVETALREALIFLRTRTGRDFSYYKRATIVRRISRRMQVNSVADLPAYLEYLRAHPAEADALLQELLISVTNFFRDRECFTALQLRLPQLFKGKRRSDTVRVWVVACATGEEAYSLAILLDEYARTLEDPPAIQLFATDLAEEAIQAGRDAIYPETIAADVSEERLRRYFVKEHHGYRVRRELRETVLFAVHDLLKDSPFSRLDLVSCRNLLIYLNREAQARAFDIFNFALRPDGLLFLGSSESAEDAARSFEVLDKRNRLYAPRLISRVGLPIPSGPGTLATGLAARESARERLGTPAARVRRGDSGDPLAASWGELHFQLLERVAAPSVLVNHEHEIVHLSANAGRFLQFSGGEPTQNLLRLVHPAMRIELRAALYRAAQPDNPRQEFRAQVDIDGGRRHLHVRVSAATDLAPNFFLVVFEADEIGPSSAEAPKAPVEHEPITRQLERENEGLKSHLRDVVEQSEASSEELKASNEELQAMNEEMRSATEELETSREELQSINEELTTVNQEMKNKVDELGRSNSDLQNLISATAIATVFLDRDLRITRYTPSAVPLFRFIPSDVGRPLSDLTRQRDYGLIEQDAAKALSHLTPTERELRIEDRWYLARTLPYRITEDRIAGVVLTFVDITERKEAEKLLRDAGEQLEARVRDRTAELATTNETLRAEVEMRIHAQEERERMVRQLMTAQEQERGRISRGLHDEVGQNLAALMLDLSSFESIAGTPAAPAKFAAMRTLVEKLSRQIHELAVELRPTALDDLGLVRAVSNYLEKWSKRTGIRAEFSSEGLDAGRLPDAVETTIYRVVCEALNNVFKHAQASAVSVVLQRRPDRAVAVIEDNGVGFHEDAAPTGKKLGVLGMKERAEILGGELSIESGPRGTAIYLRLPIGTQLASDALR